MVEQNTTKDASPTGGLWNPSRFSGEAYTVLLCVGFAFFKFFILSKRIIQNIDIEYNYYYTNIALLYLD